MTRVEHLEWCKQRAREYLDRGDARNAIASMLSDMSKHPETAESAKGMALIGMFEAKGNNVEGARRFVEGFN